MGGFTILAWLRRPGNGGRWTATAGVAAGIAVLWALHQLSERFPFAPYSAGNRVIRHTPIEVTTRVIEWFESDAKTLLAIAVIAGALVGGYLMSAQRPWLLGLVAGAVVLGAVLLDPVPVEAAPAAASVLLAACVVFAVALLLPTGVAAVRARLPLSDTLSDAPTRETDPGRRRLLRLAVAGGGVVLVAGAVGAWRLLRDSSTVVVSALRQNFERSVHDPSFLEMQWLSSAITPNDRHYVIRLSFNDPVVEPEHWTLPITGAVAEPVQVTLDDLRALGREELPVAMVCISNGVGGEYAGNARWAGVPLRAVLDRVQVLPTAAQVRATSYDGYDETIDLDVLNVDTVLVVYEMNGEPLPRRHGAPARLIHVGRFGMRSVKWLEELELIEEPALGYWERQGWDEQAVMLTSSRIDVPALWATTVERPFFVAGVAWAGVRGISAIELSTDEGVTWLAARMERALGEVSWRRWQLLLDLPPGEHVITVRAIEADGTVQEAERRRPHPAGATGYHTRRVTVVEPAPLEEA